MSVKNFLLPLSEKSLQEEGDVFAPRFDQNGLITTIACDFFSNEILMLAYMNEAALRLTLNTGIAHYWSRSRKALWKKGETSGNMQYIKKILVDCDQDALLLKVEIKNNGPTCHTGRTSCFYRQIINTKDQELLQKII